MSLIHEKLAKEVTGLRAARAALLASHADETVAEITVRQLLGGLRGVPALLCDTSVVDPDKGLVIRGIPVAHLAGTLPEAVLWLLLTGETPGQAELDAFVKELAGRSETPAYVWEILEAMPGDAHPMMMLSTAVLAMEKESRFRRSYEQGLARDHYWEPALEDALRLVASLPELAAGVYRLRYGKGGRVAPDPGLDWAANFAHMLGIDDERFYELMRIAMVVQSDHEGGHVSALASHVVGSALANPYCAFAAAMNGLAGPLHGLASQVCLEWVLGAMDRYGGVPTEAEVKAYAWETLGGGRVIPGYGHAVLRGQDPRYVAFLVFGEKHCARDDVFKTVVRMSKVIPSVLMEQGKVKNPWPNVDAMNGAVYRHFGLTEVPYYTVLFGVALSLGLMSQYVLNRVVGSPIVRPRSVSSVGVADRFKKK